MASLLDSLELLGDYQEEACLRKTQTIWQRERAMASFKYAIEFALGQVLSRRTNSASRIITLHSPAG